ncbi:MAG: PAS domain S-box protein [Phycisphaerales bacterium]
MQAAARDRAALAAALDPIFTIDLRGAILSASDSVLSVFGWRPSELIGRDVSVLMPEPHRSAHAGDLERYARTGESRIMGRPRELEAVRRDGSIFPVELSISRAEVPDHGEPLFVGIVRDITERNRVRDELARHQDQLERLVEERTEELRRSIERIRMADRLAFVGTLAAGPARHEQRAPAGSSVHFERRRGGDARCGGSAPGQAGPPRNRLPPAARRRTALPRGRSRSGELVRPRRR